MNMTPGMFYVARRTGKNADKLVLESVPFVEDRLAQGWKEWLVSCEPTVVFVVIQVMLPRME